MDDFDHATAVEEKFRELAIAAATGRQQAIGESRLFCADPACGEPIPEPRRVAISGCQFCIECQSRREMNGRNVCR
ncbi:TraR/DksA C4-type zinc finger protein [Burkholderia gladioli]|uniref:TraR/DksA C4-type zinc finger protein n=1 Tax=Burkholderia gladioli TaxID=28095 RepID=UPI0016410663|nr:TraR/DksA C4-type zinc finger protein [Burkholderia gladioli]